MFTDGTFLGNEEGPNHFGIYRLDGDYYIELQGREPGNMTLLLPGDAVRHALLGVGGLMLLRRRGPRGARFG